jgi:arabinose-5-phosphate isomerase
MAPPKPTLKSVKPVAMPPAAADGLAPARRVLSYASEALAGLAAALDGDFTRAVAVLEAAKGRVIVSGMGKSGHIAHKIAATLSSTGTPAYFVHPTEASHGDLGAITRQDVLLMLSWGGESAELSDLITYAKRFRIPLIGVTGHAGSSLGKAADVRLVLPPAPEACPMGMAPTTSTTMMLSLGDALAVTLMERKGFSADQYRDFHPGGSLGRALVRVCDLMHPEPDIPLEPGTASMRDVLLAMARGRLGCVGIIDDTGGLCGIITDGDLSRHLDSDNFLNRSARSVMTRNPKIVHPEQLAAEALAYMNEHKITRLFVLADGDAARKPLGVIHIHDVLRAGVA